MSSDLIAVVECMACGRGDVPLGSYGKMESHVGPHGRRCASGTTANWEAATLRRIPATEVKP
jgi:hypothetical protein